MITPAWRLALVAALFLGACARTGDGSIVAGDTAPVPAESTTTLVEATTPTTSVARSSTPTTTPATTTTTTAGPTATTTTAGPTATTTTTVDLSGLDDALDELEGLLDDLNTIETEGELP